MVEIDGTEALAATLEWLAMQMRRGFVRGVSLELSGTTGRLAVSLNVDAPPDVTVTPPHVEVVTKEGSDPEPLP